MKQCNDDVTKHPPDEPVVGDVDGDLVERSVDLAKRQLRIVGDEAVLENHLDGCRPQQEERGGPLSDLSAPVLVGERNQDLEYTSIAFNGMVKVDNSARGLFKLVRFTFENGAVSERNGTVKDR